MAPDDGDRPVESAPPAGTTPRKAIIPPGWDDLAQEAARRIGSGKTMTEAIREVVEELQRRDEQRWERAKRDGRIVSIPVERDEATGSLLIAHHRATRLPAEPVVRFSSGRNQNRRPGTHDHEPLELTPSGLADRFKRPKRGPKMSAGYYAQTVFAPGRRTGADIIAPPSLAVLDVDYGNLSIDELMLELPPVGLIVHSTSSHRKVTDANPNALTRWRVVIPIVGVKLTRDEHRLLIRGLERELYGALGVDEYDSCTERLTQLLYWSTDETVDDLRNFECVDTLDRPSISAEQILLLIDEQRELEVSPTRSQIAPKPFRRQRPEVSPHSSVIRSFNEAFPLEDMLRRFGYVPTSNPHRWRTPRSKAGDDVAILEGDDGVWRAHSHRLSDRGTEYEMMSSFDLVVCQN